MDNKLENDLSWLIECLEKRVSDLNEEMYHLDGISITRAYLQGKKDVYASMIVVLKETIKKGGNHGCDSAECSNVSGMQCNDVH